MPNETEEWDDPDPPEAPVHWDNAQASAWQQGWISGWRQARAQSTTFRTKP